MGSRSLDIVTLRGPVSARDCCARPWPGLCCGVRLAYRVMVSPPKPSTAHSSRRQAVELGPAPAGAHLAVADVLDLAQQRVEVLDKVSFLFACRGPCRRGSASHYGAVPSFQSAASWRPSSSRVLTCAGDRRVRPIGSGRRELARRSSCLARASRIRPPDQPPRSGTGGWRSMSGSEQWAAAPFAVLSGMRPYG